MAPTRKKAETLFRTKRYADVIRLLEPQIFRFREDFRFYQILGLSCLHTGDYGGAYTYLKRALQIRENDNLTALALALVHARRHETNDALRLWFEVLDTDPKNVYALKGIELSRKMASHTDYAPEEVFRIQKLVPGGSRVPRTLVFISAGICAVILAAVLLYPILYEKLAEKPLRDNVTVPEIDSYPVLVETGGVSSIILTEQEVRSTYKKALGYFQEYRDNMCRKELNRILLSNASQPLKDQAGLLVSHLRAPSFTTLKDPFTYSEVASSPQLYEGCYVIWKGKLSNLSRTDTEIRFDFLVGYNDNKVLEGIVPVRLTFAADLDPYYPIELLGRVTVKGAILALDGVSIHRLAP